MNAQVLLSLLFAFNHIMLPRYENKLQILVLNGTNYDIIDQSFILI